LDARPSSHQGLLSSFFSAKRTHVKTHDDYIYIYDFTAIDIDVREIDIDTNRGRDR
jgi:hypothetical protein